MSTAEADAVENPPSNSGDSSAASPEHVPDESRLPKCVTGWQRMEESQLFEDRSQLLVAVPINDRHSARKWYYEYSVVTIHCDEESFSVSCEDEPWGWDIYDVDFWVLLRR